MLGIKDVFKRNTLSFNLIWFNSPKLCFGKGKYENLGFHKTKLYFPINTSWALPRGSFFSIYYRL